MTRIEIQQDELKPLPPDKLTFELLSPKRDVVKIRVQEGNRETRILGVVEHRGDALTLSRTDGRGDVRKVAEALARYYRMRYGVDGLRIIDTRKDGQICDCTLINPIHFSGFLHLIHNTGAFDYPSTESSPEIYDQTKHGDFKDREPYRILIELADRVYQPLLREVVSWNDPIRATFSEWTNLELSERMWTNRVPRSIIDLLTEAKAVFANQDRLRARLNDLILEVTNSTVISLGLVKEDELGSIDFRLVMEPGGTNGIYIRWIWEMEKNLSDYVMDIVELYPQYRMKWWLETWLSPRPSGIVRLVGGNRETREIIDSVLRILMSTDFARDLQENNRKIKALGRNIYALIDQELARS